MGLVYRTNIQEFLILCSRKKTRGCQGPSTWGLIFDWSVRTFNTGLNFWLVDAGSPASFLNTKSLWLKRTLLNSKSLWIIRTLLKLIQDIYTSYRYNERQLIHVTVVRRVRPRAIGACHCEGHRRRKRPLLLNNHYYLFQNVYNDKTNYYIFCLSWGFLRAFEPDHPGTVNQWTNENVCLIFVCL